MAIIKYSLLRYEHGEIKFANNIEIDTDNKDDVANIRWLHQQPETIVIPPVNGITQFTGAQFNKSGAMLLVEPDPQ